MSKSGYSITFIAFPNKNMPPLLYVFVHPQSTNAGSFITRLEKEGYSPFVDTTHGNDYYWFKRNFKHEHRFYTFINDSVVDYTVDNLDEEMEIKPDIAISYCEGEEMSSYNWALLLLFIEYGFGVKELSREDSEVIKEVLPVPVKQKASLPEIDETITTEYYELKTRYFADHDTIIYEVKKPYTDLPYTTITKNFSNVGHTPFFTSLFICQSWGVCKEDILFLKKTWNEMNMDGEFDLDVLLKERTEACYPSDNRAPEPEPTVYRRTLQQVLDLLQKRQNGSKINF